MRLPTTEFTGRPWRVHDVTADFDVEDVWRLPTPGAAGDLHRLVDQMSTGDEGTRANPAVRVLFEIRFRLGRLFGWDDPEQAVGARVGTLRDRLPRDLHAVRGPDMAGAPFTSVFLTDDEWVAESANRTVHVLLHLGWVRDSDGGYYAQMSALVKPNGWFGRLYLTAIDPFRRWLVVPPLVRLIGREWERETAA